MKPELMISQYKNYYCVVIGYAVACLLYLLYTVTDVFYFFSFLFSFTFFLFV